ncbi:MAG: helix-turn-helix domain containing protein [Proteobacteria bacterium]|nr:helix-turn-helix domain containing protein [Pseudomonadota bacterium]
MATKTDDNPKRQRFAPAEREQLIVDGAIQFFADVGFAGQTRELAQRLGITQPLLYRYFPTKQDLIERVFEDVFIGRWKVAWERLIDDRTIPLRERLIDFYDAYASEALTYEWIRIYMFAGLAGEDINRRYIELLEHRLLIPICTEIRATAGAPDPDQEPISDLEIEAAWNIHAAIFYYFVRKFIYRSPVEADLAAYISDTVDRTLEGALAVTKRTVGTDHSTAVA